MNIFKNKKDINTKDILIDDEYIPSVEEIEKEYNRIKEKKKYNSALRGTINLLIFIAAISILISSFLFPILQIYGASMTPALNDGELVICRKTHSFEQGDIVAFYYNNKILLKRMIAGPGDWVEMDQEGNVYVNNTLLDEPYVDEKALGNCDIECPYQVPENRYFFMGDHRSVSIDSRHSTIGCVSDEQIVGKLVLKIWPLKSFSIIK